MSAAAPPASRFASAGTASASWSGRRISPATPAARQRGRGDAGMSGKLQEMLEVFRSDEAWNTPEPDGGHRFDKELEWLEGMVKSYAQKLGLPEDRVVEIMEKNRTYSWPNYYQPGNFPDLDSTDLVGVFDTYEAFHEHTRKRWKGFTCPKCGTISPHPQLCIHRLENDGKCDWCSYGLFKSFTRVIILENGLEAIPIFKPAEKEEAQEP